MVETKRKITIQEIAARANVSISTVSRVINATGPVADDKRQAVLKAIAELNYRPNLLLQGLTGGQTMTIGVVTQLLSSPFYDAILRGIVDEIAGTRYLPIFVDGYWEAERERQAIEALLDRKMDGMIVLGGNEPEDYLAEVAEHLPLIVIARRIAAIEAQCLYLDNVAAAMMATRFLIEQGHRRIAFIAGLPTHQDALDRGTGYRMALEEAGIEPDPDWVVQGDFTEASGVLAVEMLMTRGKLFSALFAGNDQMALGARLAFYRRGIRVPEDISILGFDDQAPAAYATPPLTTVQWSPLEVGKTAAQGLLALLQGKPLALKQIPPRLIVRESVTRK